MLGSYFRKIGLFGSLGVLEGHQTVGHFYVDLRVRKPIGLDMFRFFRVVPFGTMKFSRAVRRASPTST